MKKILYVHHAGGIGGAPKSLSFLISDLDKSKYSPVVLMVEDGPARKLFEEAGADVIIDTRLGAFHGSTVSGMSISRFIRNILYVLPSYTYGKKIVKRIKPDLVHLNSSSLFIFGKVVKDVNKNIPVISHIREPLLDSFFGDILKYMNHKYVDAFIAIENYDLSTMNTKNKMTKVVYNSVDFELYNPTVKSEVLRDELNLTKEDTVVLYLARIAESNGTLEFVKTIKSLVDKSNIHVAVIGYNDENTNEYEQKVIDESSDNIHVMRFRDDIPNVIASSDIMVAPFTQPHFARAVIEAAAMCKPSIVSNVKGLDELVVDGETGYIYNLNNPNDLNEKIERLVNDKELRAQLGENAYQRAKRLFDTKKNSQMIFEMYNDILE